MELHGILSGFGTWNSMEFHGVPWKIFHGTPWKIFHGTPWNSVWVWDMEFHGNPWRFFFPFMGFQGIPWNSMEVFLSMEFHRVFSMEFFHGILFGILNIA